MRNLKEVISIIIISLILVNFIGCVHGGVKKATSTYAPAHVFSTPTPTPTFTPTKNIKKIRDRIKKEIYKYENLTKKQQQTLNQLLAMEIDEGAYWYGNEIYKIDNTIGSEAYILCYVKECYFSDDYEMIFINFKKDDNKSTFEINLKNEKNDKKFQAFLKKIYGKKIFIWYLWPGRPSEEEYTEENENDWPGKIIYMAEIKD